MARGFSSSRVAGPAASTASNESLGASRVWTPLRENYFEPPLLSSRERAYLVRKSCEAAQELVERARSAGGPIAWRHVEKDNGVQIYAGSPRSTATGAALTAASMCGVTSVPGTVKEVASLFQLGSTRQMKEFARAHREWFYDGVVLHTLAPRTKEKPLHQVTAKWMVVQMPHGLPHRDFCYLECQDKFIDARGRKGWVLGQHSIKLPGCDDLKKEFGLVRGSLYHSGFVLVESEERPGHVDVIHLVQLNLKEHTPVPASLLRMRVLFVAQVRNMLRSKRLNEQRYLSDLELVPRKYRARCAVCQDSFSLLLLRKMNCRKCGEVVCAACSKEFPIENRNFAATNGGDEVRKLRICMHCFQVITNAPKPTSALVEPPHSSTMSMSFLGYHDDDRRASFMTSCVGGRHGHREEEAPKIFLQSMRREKPSSRRMSSTSPIPGFGADFPPSTSRHCSRGQPPDADLYRRSQRYQQQQQDYSRSRDHRGSQRMRPSDFRPSQSLSLDDPIARGEGRITLQMPGPPAVPSPASIFDRPVPGASRRPPNGIPRSQSSDMLLGNGRNMSNFSRLQELSSRERLEQLQRQDNYMSRSSSDHRMPDAYMSALQQASRDKHDFDAPPMYHAPPSDFGAYGATLADHAVIPDFGPYDATLDDPNAPPPLEMSALTTSASTIPIDLNSMSMAAMPPTAPRDGGRDHELRRQREREIEQRRSSTSSDSSASSIDIDTYDDPPTRAVVPPIAEQKHDESMGRMTQPVQSFVAAMENDVKAANIYDTDEDSETSMGASDDEEERRVSAKLSTLSSALARKPVDDDVEETKAQEFAETPALPPPSPSAHTATRNVLERPSIANSLVGSQLAPPFTDNTQAVAPKKTGVVEVDLIDRDQQLQRSKVEDLIDYEYDQTNIAKKRDEHVSETSPGCDEDKQVDRLARKYSLHGQMEAPTDGQQSESDDEAILNTVGCDMNYLDADMRQFHDQSLFIRQSHDGGASQSNDEMSPYERMPTSPKTKSGKALDLAIPSRPTINREGTFALENMSVDERQRSTNTRAGSANRVVLGPSELSDKSSPSTTRTDDRFATGVSLVSTAVDGAADDLAFKGAQRGYEVPRDRLAPVEDDSTPPVIPMSMMLAADTLQTSGDEVSESRARASSRISFSSVPSSSARGSSICSMGLDAITPPATPPSASPVAIERLSATSASSPAALDLATSTSPSFNEAIIPPRSNSTAPAYLPDRFRAAEQQTPPKEEPTTSTASSTPRQSTDSSSALDNFQLNFSASFNAHQQQKAQAGGVTEDASRLQQDERNRASSASSTGSNDVQVFRYQSVGSSVLDTVPASGVSEDEDSEDESMLLSARQLYGRFGNTKQLSKLGGDRPGFQHTLSQIQQSFDELSSDSEDEEKTPATQVAGRRG
ncbi:uncharacterized protein PITG_08974 [Phytophthora infestans T30-4]|uniref:FYVE-type domain-containing protein n=1 Tax=Phytophthora infestans (strain T30-4) TaxID=403677 RepID=D0NDM5_PHYIT|nr:uncharacterized protein PITG_08974 [Phytophthora infestans T30-4]EEY56182.1 conserved hypothetical protein [Phytophthora infestans T30-4]|eukprot:XP_002903012.1 conserved hypothetical protein [Phytophthora infestans T30-4]